MSWIPKPLVNGEEKEPERKAAIKEKERATSEKIDDQSEPVSAGALEDNQDQREPGATLQPTSA